MPVWGRKSPTYDTGDKGEYQANNLIVASVLYTASPTRKVIALDAATGRELWKWDAQSEGRPTGGGRQRGLVFWQNEIGGEQRLFTGVGNHLYSLDPKSEIGRASWREKLLVTV